MNIDNSIKSKTTNANPIELDRPGKKATAEAASAPIGESVKISSMSAYLQAIERGFANTPVVNSARVAELKQAISDGHFKVDSEKVADRLLNTVRELILTHKA